MSFDLAELQSKVNNYTTVVGSWMKNVGNLYFSATPQNVSVKLLDENGNVKTNTIPNVAQFRKTVWDDVGGAMGQFSKTVYVDSANGNDTNDGTSSAPIKTLKKAIDSTPIGGVVTIFVTNTNTDYILDSDINCYYKTITIKGVIDSEDNVAKITSSIYGADNNRLCAFLVNNTTLVFSNVKVEIPLDTNGAYSYAKGLISSYQGSSQSNIIFEGSYSRILQRGAFVFISGNHGGHGSSFLNIKFNYAVQTTLESTTKLIDVYRSSANIIVGSATFANELGNGVSLGDYISGMVKDTNNVPRNVLSNLVF